MKNTKKWGLMMAALLVFAFPAVVSADELTPSITVQGNGRVAVTPDLGTITFAVTEEGEEADVVQKTITEKANAVRDALFQAGLAEDHFKTAGIQLYTRYDYSEGVEKAIGYHGQVSMSADEIGIAQVGQYLQILSENGVNQIDGISVFYSGYEEAYCEALGKAMQQAREKAEALAQAGKARLTGDFTAAEGYQNTALQGRADVTGNYEMAKVQEAAPFDDSLDFSAGTTEVEAVVTVCYAIDIQAE